MAGEIGAFLKRPNALLKAIGIAVQSLLLLIPLTMIGSFLNERLTRRNEAVGEITNSWGREQQIVGPVLSIPYRRLERGTERQIVNGVDTLVPFQRFVIEHAYFLPAQLDIDGAVDPHELHRGIYKAVVYGSRVHLTGSFTTPDFSEWHVEPHDVMWDDAELAIAIPDMRGVHDLLHLKWNDAVVALTPGTRLPGFKAGITARLDGGTTSSKTGGTFAVDLNLSGSETLYFAPLGMQTTTKLTSAWPTPSFKGAFLPDTRSVTAQGFSAAWRVSYYGRDFAQKWTEHEADRGLTVESARASSFGVQFLSPIDSYRNVERSIKYGFLFIVLVFTTFFLFEVLSGLRIHPIQYALVGAALCLFYLSLLSLSEFTAFPIAYFVSAQAATVLISLYSWN